MPLRTPQKGESKEEHIDICMADSTMNKEFPDNKQRFAVCNSLWEKSSGNLSDKLEKL